MDHRIELFRNILEERRQETSNFMWVSRKLNTVVSYKQSKKPTPNDHKVSVLQSAKIQDFIRKVKNHFFITSRFFMFLKNFK